MIERAPLPILEVQGINHRVTQVNSAACTLLGEMRENLVDKPFAEIVPGGEECADHIAHVGHTGEAAIHTYEDRSGALPVYWLYAMWPALDRDDRSTGVIIHLTKTAHFRADSTAINEALLIAGLHQHELTDAARKVSIQLQEEVAERTRAEAALHEAVLKLESAQRAAEHAGRAKDDFLAALSHELRTPLTPVLMAAAALLEDERLPADVREQLGAIERNIALEARLIDDLLDLTKIAHGKLQLRGQPCDLHRLIDFAIEIVQEEAQARGIEIERGFAARYSNLFADPTRFQQVIWNLLRNAVKFSPHGGRVSVRTRDELTASGEPLLRIEIADSGLGIDAARLEKIFMPFDQGGREGDHRFGGVGLGLAISRAVVELHRGKISAQSEGENRGTTFIIELPGAVPPATWALPAVEGSVLRPPIKVAVPPLRLLLVEDHESTLQTIARLLRNDGHQVEAVATVADALAVAATHQFDFVISDVGLPDGTGDELMKELRKRYSLRGIALTGYGSDKDIERSLAAGFVAHLVKPVRMAELRRVIALLMAAAP